MKTIPIVCFYTFVKRLRGLMFKATLSEDSFYHIKPCNSIHTMMMVVPIDLVFLDKDNRILGLYTHVKPYRLKWHKGAHSVLEGRVGLIQTYALLIGEQVHLSLR